MAESFTDRFRKGLERTRDILNADVEDLVRGRRPLKPEDLDAFEDDRERTGFGKSESRFQETVPSQFAVWQGTSRSSSASCR